MFYKRHRFLIPVVILAILSVYLIQRYVAFVWEYEDIRPLQKVYVINLDRSPERYRKLSEQLNSYGIKHERFPAVDGYKLKIEDVKTGEIFTGLDLKDGRKKMDNASKYIIHCPNVKWEYTTTKRRILSAGEFGCSCSHMGVWYDIKKNKVDYALVFEDDVILKDNFKTNLDLALSAIPKNWDIFYLNLTVRDDMKYVIMNNKIYKIRDDVTGSTAMLVNSKSTEKMLKLARNSRVSIDKELSKMIGDREISAYATKEFLAETDGNAKSDISVMGR